LYQVFHTSLFHKSNLSSKMLRIISGEDIHVLPKPDRQLQTVKQSTTSQEEIGITTSSSSSVSDDAMSLSSSAVVTSKAGSASANVVENDNNEVNDIDDDNDVIMEMNNTAVSSVSDTNHLTRTQQHQHQHSINDINISTPSSTAQREQYPPHSSVLTALLSTVGGGRESIPRNNSRNSATAFSSKGRQSSQNSSRDWGWFEDMHHFDHGAVSSSVRGLKVAVTSQHNRSSSVNCINNKNGKIDETMTRTNNNDNQPVDGSDRSRSSIDTITSAGRTSLLRTGDEMLIDDMEEYLEPILLDPRSRDIENEAAVQAVTAPNYVLEESLSDQFLWKNTAGNRPPQPVEERAFFEAMWARNFAHSEVEYKMPAEVLTATTPVSLNPFADGNFGASATGIDNSNYTNLVTQPAGADTGVGGVGGKQDVAEATLVSRLNDPSQGIHSFVVPGMSGTGHGQAYLQNEHKVVKSTSGSSGDLTVFTKGDNVFGTTVSKSFARPSVNGDLVTGVDTVNISVASYRVVESEKRGKHAQFLVIYREGSIRDTIGVWKRYSDFQDLSKKVTKIHEGCASVIANMSPLAVTEEHDVEHLPNAITSWHLLQKRKRWYRCLDPGYLSLKVFLLERFLHDILFESSSPDLLRDFVGVPPPE